MAEMITSNSRSSRMNQITILVLSISFFLAFHRTNCLVNEEVKTSLIKFLAILNGSSTGQPDPIFGWNNATDPCQGTWQGVECNPPFNNSIRRIILDKFSLSGILDASSLCNVQPLAASLVFVKLKKNNIGGQVPVEITNCRSLTHLLIGHNQFSGNLPESLAMLNNLKKLDISYNNFSGCLPGLARISGLIYFLAEYNQLSGVLPSFDFLNFEHFNVSYNNFSGPIPDVKGKFNETSFLDNPDLCGPPLSEPCPPLSYEKKTKDKGGVSKTQILMYSGYILVGLLIITFITFMVCKGKKKEEKHSNGEAAKKLASIDDSMNKLTTGASSEYKMGTSRPDFSVNSAESAMSSTSLIVLTSPVVNGLKFEDLLRAPAELLGRGKHGSVYKVIFENGMILAVKRIKDWEISSSEFKQRMQKIYQASHPDVLPPLAFYCSQQEKLLVYEYQQNGSLFGFLHGALQGQAFDWRSRLGVAVTIAEALAFMHRELHDDGYPHGNLKSSNILLNKNMEPCISEYGLMAADNANLNGKQQNQAGPSDADPFKADIHGFGVILLELLTGKLVQNDGADLTTWVHSVVREEWTAEVFDRALISEGASEERMVNLLQVAVKCVNLLPEARPTINQVAAMINTIVEKEERSMLDLDTPNTSMYQSRAIN